MMLRKIFQISLKKSYEDLITFPLIKLTNHHHQQKPQKPNFQKNVE